MTDAKAWLDRRLLGAIRRTLGATLETLFVIILGMIAGRAPAPSPPAIGSFRRRAYAGGKGPIEI
jgi:hypothetical protein